MRVFLFAVLLCTSLMAFGGDQPSEADDAYAKADWPKVVSLYVEKTRENPNDALAWWRIGRAHEELKQYAEAQDAFTHAAQLKFPLPTIWAKVAANAAAAGHREQALSLLESMAQNGFAFPKVIQDDARFAPVKHDPRFAAAVQKIDYNSSPCDDPSHPEYRQLDFWVGEWNVFDTVGNKVGESSVQKIIHDCVIYENWTGAFGPTGKSFNKYNAPTRQWEQYWVDESPARQYYKGAYADKRMVYMSDFTNPQGQHTLGRLTFFDQPDGTVRQFSEASTDEGKTWQTNYDFTYRRK